MTEQDKAKARRAAQVFTEGMSLMRSVLADDEVYLHMLKEVEQRVLGLRRYMEFPNIKPVPLPPRIALPLIGGQG